MSNKISCSPPYYLEDHHRVARIELLAKRELRVDLRQAHNDFHPESKEGKKGIRSWQEIKIQDRRPAHYIGLIKTPMISDGGVAYFGR